MPDGEQMPKRANVTELEQISGLTRNPVMKHIRRHNISKGKDGKYPTRKVLDAILTDKQMDARTGGGDANGMAVNKIKATKTALECQILQVKLDQLKGLMWMRDDVLSSWSERNAQVRAVIENFRQRETAENGTTEGKSLIDALCDGILNELSEDFRE